MAESLNTLLRLVALKREALDVLRQDAGHLERTVNEASTALSDAEGVLTQAYSDACVSECKKGLLNPTAMLMRRAHLGALQNDVKQKGVSRHEAINRRDEARRILEIAFREVRLMEKMNDRRVAREQLEQQRREYAQRDDQEVSRSAKINERHG